MDLHRVGEARSLAYHRSIAARLAAEPALVERARARLSRWLVDVPGSRPYLERWLRLLDGPRDEFLRVMLDEGEDGRTMRSCGPFAGEMPPKERWALWRAVRERLESES